LAYTYEIEQYIRTAKQARYSLFLSLEEEWSQGEIWGCNENWEIYEELTNDITYLETILADGVDGECATDIGYEEVISHISKNAALAELCDGVSFTGIFAESGGGTNPPTPPSDDCCQFDGQRAITSLPEIGDNFNTTTVKDFLEAAYFTAAPPTAALTGGNTRELGSSTAVTLNWTATRGGNAITGITVDGTVISPTGNTQGGSQAATATQDVTTAFNMSVTDGTDIATASTTVLWKSYNWYGSVATLPTTSANVRALGGNTFNSSFTIVTGTTNLYFAFWLPTGTSLTSVIDTGNLNLNITADFVSSALSVNDAGGTPRTGNLFVKTNGVPFSPSTNLLVTTS